MSSAVVSTSAALGRPFVFEEEIATHVGTAAHGCPEPSRRGCPVEQSSTATHAAPSLPGVARHDSRGRLSPHGSLIQSNNQRFPPSSILPASQLEVRPAPEMASSGISALDALTGGLPRGCLTEICGSASSGRTTVLLAALAAATRRGEYCALLDASDALDPRSIAAAGVDLDRMLWVRCGDDSPRRHRDTEKIGNKNLDQKKDARPSEHRLDQVLRATDLLLESGGFGLIVLDLADLPAESARRIPLTTWFRFRRAVEHKPTILLAIEQQPIAGSCSSLRLQLENAKAPLATDNATAAKRRQNAAHGASRGLGKEDEQAPEGRKKIYEADQFPMNRGSGPSHAHLLTGLNITAELIRSRIDRKPAHSVLFATKTAWAG